MQLRDFIPPIAGKLKARLRKQGQAREYISFDDALIACGGVGYNDHRIADVVRQKTIAYRERLSSGDHPLVNSNAARQLLPLALSAEGDELSVLDLGGGCGVHYFLARKVLEKMRLRWCVVETPAMVQAARTLESDELRFFTALETAVNVCPRPTTVFSSGALHYLANPYAALESLIALGAPNLFLTRVALSCSDSDHVFIHESALNKHGRGGPLASAADIRTRCPVYFASKRKFEQLLAGKYEIIFELSEAAAAYEFGNFSFAQYGYHCRRGR